MTKLKACKAILDFILFMTIGNVAIIASYLWMVIMSGWVMGEMLFDRKMFHARYGGDPEQVAKAVRDVQDRDLARGWPA